jgi:hypothetical protein
MSTEVYAFDADSPGAPLWSRNFNGSAQASASTEVEQNCSPYNDFRGDIGIVGTPVIDASAGTMYCLERNYHTEPACAQHCQRGRSAEQSSGYQASVPGNGDGGISVAFNPQTQN